MKTRVTLTLEIPHSTEEEYSEMLEEIISGIRSINPGIEVDDGIGEMIDDD